MNIEEIDKWLDNEYGCSYTRLEELHDYFFEKYTDQKEEIERLKDLCDKYEEEHKTTFEEWKKAINIIKEDKNISKLDFIEENTFSKRQNGMTSEDRRLLDSNFKEIGNKINEIIDKLNEIEGDKE